MNKLSELRAKAEACQKASRDHYHDIQVFEIEDVQDFVLAASPEAVLELIKTIEELRDAAERVDYLTKVSTRQYTDAVEKLQDTLAKLKERWGT